jgi:hypothetical protein
VKRAVKELQTTGQVVPDPKTTRQRKYEQRQSVRGAFQELLRLLLARAEHEALIVKVQELQRLVQPLMGVKKRRT